MTTKADIIIRDLLNALDVIQRASSLPYAQGAAEQAIKNTMSLLVRNADGYLTVKQ